MNNKTNPFVKIISVLSTVLLLFSLNTNIAFSAGNLAALTSTSTPFTCANWNLATDFRIWPNQENPNRDSCNNLDVWSFMGSGNLVRNPTNYYLLPNFTPNSGGYVGLNKYDTNTQFPHINFNAGITIVQGSITIQPIRLTCTQPPISWRSWLGIVQ